MEYCHRLTMKNVTLKHICSYKTGNTDYTGTTQCPGNCKSNDYRDRGSNDLQDLAKETHPCNTQAMAGLSRLKKVLPIGLLQQHYLLKQLLIYPTNSGSRFSSRGLLAIQDYFLMLLAVLSPCVEVEEQRTWNEWCWFSQMHSWKVLWNKTNDWELKI